MKIAILSNYYNHHMHSLSVALHERAEWFRFIETEPMTEERVRLGWGMDTKPEFVSGDLSLLKAANVVIAGSAPEYLIQKAIREGKTVFRYSERPLKNGVEPLKYLPRLVKWHWKNPVNKPVYLLAASAYAAADYRKFGLFRGKAYKWGYFPETKRYPELETLIQAKDKRRILWVGRFLGWKHPEDAMQCAAMLRNAGHDFCMDFIGTGELESALRAMIREWKLEGCVHLLGAMPQAEVRKEMEKAGIVLVTSDRKEGWGAVVNEAMNSGCAVVASHAIGSVPYLIRDGENGLVYPSGNADELYGATKMLLDSPVKQEKLGTAAYDTIRRTWNADSAAESFILLAENILGGKDDMQCVPEGPCSSAPRLGENWYVQ